MASLVRPREGARAVTPIELFFDLVYIFAVSQLSMHLVEEVGLRGMEETLVLTLAAMYAWFMTVWTSNWLDVERRQVQLMLLGLTFCQPADVDLGGRRIWRGIRCAVGQRPRRALRDRLSGDSDRPHRLRCHRLHDHFSNALVWELATGLIWIVGIFANGDARLAIWAIAVLVTYGGVIAGHPLPGRSSPFSSDSQIYAEPCSSVSGSSS
jgi:hypothetical protein